MEKKTLDFAEELPRAVRELPGALLVRYVDQFETYPDGLLSGGCYCALGAMAGIHLHRGFNIRDEVFERYTSFRNKAREGREAGQPLPYTVIEDLFERWPERGEDHCYEYDSFPDDPRLAIYEACVEELARRGAEESRVETSPALAAGGVG